MSGSSTRHRRNENIHRWKEPAEARWAGGRGRDAAGLAVGAQNPRSGQERRHHPRSPGPHLRCVKALSPEGPQRVLWAPGRCPYLEQTRLLTCGQSGRSCRWEGAGFPRGRPWAEGLGGGFCPPTGTNFTCPNSPDCLRAPLPALVLTWRHGDLWGSALPHCPPPALPIQAPGHLSSPLALQPAARECNPLPNTRTLCKGRRRQL